MHVNINKNITSIIFEMLAQVANVAHIAYYALIIIEIFIVIYFDSLFFAFSSIIIFRNYLI